LRIAVVQKADNVFRIIGHQEIETFLVENFFLAFKDLHDPCDEVIKVLESESTCNEISEKELRQTENGAADIFFIPEVAVLGQEVGCTDLRNNNREIVLVNVGVESVDYIFYPIGQAAENVQVLGIGEPFNAERTGKKFKVCLQPAACDAVDTQSPQVNLKLSPRASNFLSR